MHNTGTISGLSATAERRSQSRKEHRSGSAERLNRIDQAISISNEHYGTEVKAGGKQGKIVSSFTAHEPLIHNTLHETNSLTGEN